MGRWIEDSKVATWVVIIFFLLVFGGCSALIFSDSETEIENGEYKTVTLSSKPIERINQIVGNVGDYEVTIWDMNENFANENTPPPYEIIINSWVNDFDSCFQAKKALYEIMKGLYSDSLLQGKISRIQFSAAGYLQSSFGYDDAKMLDWSQHYGISNFWKAMLQTRPYRDESGPLSQRTWGESINNCK